MDRNMDGKWAGLRDLWGGYALSGTGRLRPWKERRGDGVEATFVGRLAQGLPNLGKRETQSLGPNNPEVEQTQETTAGRVSQTSERQTLGDA